MRKINSKNIKDLIIDTILIVLIEIIFKLISGYNLLDYSMIRILLSSIFISAMINVLYQYLNAKIVMVLNIILAFLLCFYAFFQIGANNYIGVYASINASSQLSKVTDFIAEFFSSYTLVYYLQFIPFILLIIYYILVDKHFENERKSNNIFMLIVLLTSSLLFALSLNLKFMQSKFQAIDNKTLFHYPSNQSITVNQFGIIGFGLIDIKSYILKTEYTDVSYTTSTTNTSTTKKAKKIDFSRNINDDSWNNIIENEQDNSLNNINNYLINREITDKNSHTGLLKDKNLIVIMMESVNDIVLTYPEKYPNIAKLYNEGITFNNNYSPRNSCATGNNEMTIITSLFTINNNCTYNTYRKNEYEESMFWMFRKNGYNVTSYHNYDDTFYYRRSAHPNMGSEKFYNIYDLKIPYSNININVPSDVDLIENATPNFIDEEKFMAFITTITPHRPYYNSMDTSDKYNDEFKEITNNADLRRYMSKVKVTDDAIGLLIQKLEENNKLEDTVIVLVADHYPYAFPNSSIASVLNYSIDEDYEKDRTPFIIYNPQLNHEQIYKYTTIIDVLPTLLNLFDIDYDPRLYFGEDIFASSGDKIAIYPNGSWKNEYAYYNATTGKVNYRVEDFTYMDDEIQSKVKEANSKIEMSNQIIKKNYYKYLFDNMKVNTTEDDM